MFFIINLLNLMFYLLISLPTSSDELIKSDWIFEESKDEFSQTSALELEQADAKRKALEDKKRAEEEEMRRVMEDNAARRKGLLECMKLRGVLLFMIDDCEACKIQKAYFGDDFGKVDYIDCKKNKFTCPLRQINKYPTWYMGSMSGVKKTGILDLPTLARLSGCEF
jgi:hypothetical protein